MSLKTAVFASASRLGLFAASSRATSGWLTILCYHGFALDHEHRFRPGLFMRPELFAERLAWLGSHGFRVLPLEEAVARLRAGTLRRKEIAITIDDGFDGVAVRAAPLLRRYGFPATLYVTSYYVRHNHPIFRLALQYFFWRADGRPVDVAGLLPGVTGTVVAGSPDAERVLWTLIDQGEAMPSEEARVALAREVAARAGCAYEELARSRRLTLMTEEQIARAASEGLDIQLHTHRHRLPTTPSEVSREIADNRAVLEPLVGRPLRHFCYPSGVWSLEHLPALAAEGVETATTCDSGMNRSETNSLALCRFLDRDDMPRIVFEGELYGFAEVCRMVARRRRRVDPIPPQAGPPT
jgi:peptidoglycan/xylan/chitin deacetylase (PgdA/CDA1 family)